jgi:uncharacterized membrane protein YciS (DUF1049 family)
LELDVVLVVAVVVVAIVVAAHDKHILSNKYLTKYLSFLFVY